MTKEEPKKEIAIRPPSPGATQTNGGQWRPEQLDPELANLAMAKLLVEKMGTPSIVNKQFIVRKAIFKALNHIPKQYEKIDADTFIVIDKGNPTGYDSSLRLAVYNEAERGSVNIDGQYFEKAWAFLMKPKYIINAAAGQPGQFEEEKGESIAGRIMNWFKGGKKDERNSNS
jgi:hypothetical protein